MPKLAIIAALAENGVIGRDNQLPWHIPADLRHFKALTMHKPIIMGRKTFMSIGKPLLGRTNIVITRNRAFTAAGVQVAYSINEAIKVANTIAIDHRVDEVMVIGGADIYQKTLPLADRLYLTRVHANVEGDAYFPPVNWQDWVELSREDHAGEGVDAVDYSFVVYQRR